MPTFNNLKEMLEYIQKQANETLQDEVFETTRDVMQEHIQEDVYDAYTPADYERTYELISDDNIEGKVADNTLTVKNTRHDGDRYVPEIIEEGKGYNWGYIRDLDEEIGARPFIANTKKDLQTNKQHVQAMKEGLKKRGLDVDG
jgi:hypothetical protein